MFCFQESELETEVITPTPPPTSALPIPTQTFTNANYAAPPVNVSPAVQQPYPPQTADIIYTPIPMPPQPQHMSAAQPQITVPEPQPQVVYNNPATQTFVPQNQPLPAQQQYNNQTEFQHVSAYCLLILTQLGYNGVTNIQIHLLEM